MEFHPIANEYPMLSSRDLGRIEEDMIEHGFDPQFPIVIYQKKILDGRNRFIASQNAKVEAEYVEFEGTEQEARMFVQRANEERRHLTQEWLSKRRQERLERVAKMLEAGESQRTIAEQEKVSRTTVRSDIEELKKQQELLSDNNFYTQMGGGAHLQIPDKVNGRNGVAQPREKSIKSIQDEVVLDCFQNEVPVQCRKAYCDPWIQETIDALAVIEEKLRSQRIADGMNKRKASYPFIAYQDVIDGIGMAMNAMDDVLNHLKDNRPAGVCKECNGNGCPKCRMSGMVPRNIYRDAVDIDASFEEEEPST